jgi:ABC-type bacteriocin/lantibiotic exporter with double-glycine peptidase domain
MRTTSEAPVAEPQSSNRTAGAASTTRPDRSEPRAGLDGAPGATVKIEGLAHSFGSLEVIERLDLRVSGGEVLGIVGPSGCGKSTALELVSGLRDPAAGSVAVHGDPSAGGRLAHCA